MVVWLRGWCGVWDDRSGLGRYERNESVDSVVKVT